MSKHLWGLAFGQAATDFLDAMPPGKLRAQLAKKCKSLILNQHPVGCKKLVGVTFSNEDVWRIRSGDYRILYVLRNNPNHVLVIDIDHRKDIYR